MFSVVGNHSIRNCQGWSRREFLRVGSLGLGGLALPSLLASVAESSPAPSYLRDKAVVLLFLQGGPPQIETFDPKMQASSEIRSCTGEVKTKLPGITFGGTFPKLAALADRVAVVRSFSAGAGGHEQFPFISGNSPLEATMSAHVARLTGANDRRTAMPTQTIILPEQLQPGLKLENPSGPFQYNFIKEQFVKAGQFGKQYEALLLDGGDALAGNLTLQLPQDRFDDRKYLLGQLDGFQRQLDLRGAMEGVDVFRHQAYDVLVRGIADAFDIAQEDPRTVARYDTSHLFRMEDYHRGGKYSYGLANQSRWTNLLGKQMLLARRMCERGCRFVTVIDSCWDFHGDVNNPPVPVGMPVLGPQADHAVAAFLEDVHQRGLSEKILLLVTGEMGRSPRKESNGGGGHWSDLAPLLVAGGGLKMGQVIGESDRDGGRATTQPYLPPHLLATILQTLFDPAELRLASGIPTKLARMITESEPIRELF